MADSASPPDIEDVLSSIRRLVSHDGGRKAADGAASPDTEKPDSKLVLTPALRVESDGGDDAVEAPEVVDAPHALLPDGEAADLMSPDVPLAFTSARAAKDKADGAEPALVLEDPVDLSKDEVRASDQAETASTEEQGADIKDDVVEAAPDPEPPTSHESLTAKIAALEEVIGREPDQWEPESEGLGDNAGTDVDALPWEDHVDDPVAEEDVAVAAPDPEDVAQDADVDVDEDADTDLDLSDMGDTILDEAMLRDLISTIVREELQGALGERITRNVRKLVRREIHRAMSAKDFN